MALLKWKNHHIEDVEVNLTLAALKERYGYDFSGYARASLKRRLLALTQYFDVKHLSELLPVLLYDDAVAQTVINNITVPTSEFFRDPDVWKQVRDTVLPQLASFPWINIWQVGCGHGEETYTLAILLHEAGLLKKTRIFTTDINTNFLREAQNACWPLRQLDAWQSNYLQAGGTGQFTDYFLIQGDVVRIRPEFQSAIEFIQHNLVKDDVFKEVQWVVCRNVLIYFAKDLQEQVLHLLSRSLERGGFLLLGHAEAILNLQEDFPELALLEQPYQLYRKMTEKIIRGHHV